MLRGMKSPPNGDCGISKAANGKPAFEALGVFKAQVIVLSLAGIGWCERIQERNESSEPKQTVKENRERFFGDMLIAYPAERPM